MLVGRPGQPGRSNRRSSDDLCPGQKAAIVTHDREFSARRRRNTIGMHIFLDCLEPDAVDLMEQHLDDIVDALERSHGDLFVRLSPTRLDISHNWD